MDVLGHKTKSLFSFWSLFLGHLPSSAGEAQCDELHYHALDLPAGEAVRADHRETSFLSKSS